MARRGSTAWRLRQRSTIARSPGSSLLSGQFTPAAGAKLGGQVCHGVFLIVTDRDRLRPVRVGLEVAAALSRLYGQQFRLEDAATLFGSKATLERIRAGEDPASIAESWGAGEARWRETRAKYLLLLIQLFGKSGRIFCPMISGGGVRRLFEREPALKADPRFRLYPAWIQQQVAGQPSQGAAGDPAHKVKRVIANGRVYELSELLAARRSRTNSAGR